MLVTNATNGIAREAACALAACNAHLILTSRNVAEMPPVDEKLQSPGASSTHGLVWVLNNLDSVRECANVADGLILTCYYSTRVLATWDHQQALECTP